MATPPKPRLTDVTDATYDDFNATAMRGFHESQRPEALASDRTVVDPARHFGFTVGERWASTFGSFERRMTVPGGADVPVAAVTLVTVQPPFRRRGLLTAMMQRELDRCVERGEPLAALWASEASIYGRFGFGPAAFGARLSGRCAEVSLLPGVQVGGWTDEVDRDTYVGAAAAVYDRGRAACPGSLDRDRRWWDFAVLDIESTREGATEYHHVLHHDDQGTVDGFALYRIKPKWSDSGPDSEVRIRQFGADTPSAHAGLWRYLLDLDLVRTFVYDDAPVDEPLRQIVRDARGVRTAIGDNVYVRVVDVAAALEARRYSADVDVVIEVTDPQLPANAGRYHLRGGTDDAHAERTDRDADLRLGVLELGTVYLGGVTLDQLQRAGRIGEFTPGAVARASAAFAWSRAPWCSDHF